MTKKVALARARKGAAYLDSKLGPGWRRKIVRKKLNLGRAVFVPGEQNSCGCVLAQLAPTRYGRRCYNDGAEKVGIQPCGADAVRLGFYNRGGEYAELTEAWLEVLREGAPA